MPEPVFQAPLRPSASQDPQTPDPFSILGDEVLPQRMVIFASMARVSYGLDIWCFGYKPLDLFATSCTCAETLEPFIDAGIFDFFIEHRSDRPMFMTDPMGATWLGAWGRDIGTFQNLLFVLGPVSYVEHPEIDYQAVFRTSGHSKELTERYLKAARDFPVVEPAVFMSLGTMLHFILTGEDIEPADCLYQSGDAGGERYYAEGGEEGEGGLQDQSAINAEKLLLATLRQGNVAAAREYLGGKLPGNLLGLASGTMYRSKQDSVIVFVALCSRAAMEGGVPLATARAMERRYVGEVERSRNVNALTSLVMRLYMDFTETVLRFGELKGYSEPVRYCCSYLQEHLASPFNLKELAAEVGYSEYYLTKKFTAEVGMKISDYLKLQRVERAKILLRTTQKGISEISSELCFGSRNYFTRVFTSLAGVTPAAYRDGDSGE